MTSSVKHPGFYLASTSPQRRKILDELGIPHTVLDSRAEEIVGRSAEETVRVNAERKVVASLPLVPAGTILLGADTVLEAGGSILGKPADAIEARQVLRAYSGSSATAYSGVFGCKAGDPSGFVGVEVARIEFHEIAEEQIDWYLSTGEPLSRAGSLGVSLYGEVFVRTIEGSHSCVTGLPKRTLLAILHALGIEVGGRALPSSLAATVGLESRSLVSR